MLESRIILEIWICGKTDCRILAEVVLIDERIVVGDGANVWAFTALEPSSLTFFERIQTVLAIGAEIHPYALIYLSHIEIRFFGLNSMRSKRVAR